jgi:hypothetical protein
VRLDLDRQRTLGELVTVTFDLFGRQLAVFLSLTLAVVAPIVLVVDGVWGQYLAEGGDVDAPTAAAAASLALGVLVIPPLVTALHVVVVQAMARGEEPTVGGALRNASARLLPAVAAVVVYSLAVAAGLVALVVPGVWLAVRWYFCAQAAVVDGLGPTAALRRSAEVVERRWWRTFGVLLGFGVVVGALGAAGGALAHEIQDGALFTTAWILVQTVTLSLSAIFGTLLFFDSRARTALPWQGTPRVEQPPPERPMQPPRI